MSLLKQLKQKFHHRPVLPPLDNEYINERIDMMLMFEEYEPLKRFVTRRVKANKPNEFGAPYTESTIAFQNDTLIVCERAMLSKNSVPYGSPVYKIMKLRPNGQFDYSRCNIESFQNPSTSGFDTLISVYDGENKTSRLISSLKDENEQTEKQDPIITNAMQDIITFNYLKRTYFDPEGASPREVAMPVNANHV